MNDHIGYNRFLFFYFNNLALDNYYTKDTSRKFNKNCIDYNKTKLDLIDKYIDKESIKNHNLKYAAREFIYTSKNYNDNKSILKHFKDKCSNEDYVADLTSLVERLENLKPGNKLPLIDFVDYSNDIVDFNSKIQRPSVIYFWSYHYTEHFIEIHTKSTCFLNNTQILISLVIINNEPMINSRQELQAYEFPLNSEFRFKNFKQGVKIMVYHSFCIKMYSCR